MAKQLRAKSTMNTVGPVLVIMCLLFNLWSICFFYVFPFTDVIYFDLNITKRDALVTHYTFFSVYVLFLFMTIWSFIVASCTDPGYVPRNINTYDPAKMSKREQLLWNYLE